MDTLKEKYDDTTWEHIRRKFDKVFKKIQDYEKGSSEKYNAIKLYLQLETRESNFYK